MRITITTLLWQRHQIFDIWAKAIQNIIEAYPKINITVVVAGSEGAKSMELVKSYGFIYLETDNEFLGRKANMRLRFIDSLETDFVWFLGSDDITTPLTLKYYLDKIEQGFEEIAPTDLYLYNTKEKQLVYSCGYLNHRKSETLAVGRMLSAKILDQVGWELWPDDVQHGLDRHATAKMSTVERLKQPYQLKETGGIIMDIKTDMNLTPFMWREQYSLADKSIYKFFNTELCDLIKAIPFTQQH